MKKRTKKPDFNSIGSLIDVTAESIFDEWLDTVPSRLKHSINRPLGAELVKTIRDSFADSMICLNRLPKSKRIRWGFDVGYIIGYVEGELSTVWNGEFLIRHHPDYIHVAWKKALLQVLTANETVRTSVHRLVEIQLNGIEEIPDSDWELTALQQTADEKLPERWRSFEKTFSDEILKEIPEKVQLALKSYDNQIRNLEKFIPYHAIEAFLNDNLS